jgi:hypothetical protein
VKPDDLDDPITTLCAQAGLPPPVGRQPVRGWALSAVERVVLLSGGTVICKYARPPFTGEATVLATAAQHGVPVPAMHASLLTGDLLIMLLEDLGDPTHTPTDQDGAAAAALLHRANPTCPDLPICDSPALADLPHKMLDTLTGLRASGRLDLGTDMMRALASLSRQAKRRAAGAQTPPFGFVHGELHPTSIHIGPKGKRIIDFGMAFTGPGILDLATWQGTRQPPNPRRLTNQLDAYAITGGTKYIHTPRGGLPAATWALGWHRLHSAAWLVQLTASGSEGFDPNTTEQILRRQISASTELLR